MTYVRLVIIFVVLCIVGFVEAEVYKAGYNSARSSYEAQLGAIKDATLAEQRKEADAAQRAFKEAGEAIAKLQDGVDDAQQDLVDSSRDVNAKRPALGTASVQRLNRSSGY